MTSLDLVLLILASAGAAYAAAAAVSVVRMIRAVPVLSARGGPPPPARWPRLSVVVPARDEAEEIEAAVLSRLADDYPDLELVLVDDRSTDGTGAVIDRLAARDPRVRALHLIDLPPGWLGKLHALHRGAAAATGELLLFSDADVRVSPGTSRRAVARMEAERLDHLAVFPRFLRAGWLLDAALAAFCRQVLPAGRPWAVPDPNSGAAFGVGAFNLVRRSALERSPGFPHLRLEQADDVALAQMIKRSGGRSAVTNGRDDVRLRFYRSLGDMAGAVEKTGARWPFPLFAAVLALMAALELGPWIALAANHPAPRAVGLAGVLLAVGATVAVAAWLRNRIGPALLAPLGALLLVGLTFRAALLALVRGGVSWRGTFHASADLRAGRRFEFGRSRPPGGAPPPPPGTGDPATWHGP